MWCCSVLLATVSSKSVCAEVNTYSEPGHHESCVTVASQARAWSSSATPSQFCFGPKHHQTMALEVSTTVAVILAVTLLFVLRLERERGKCFPDLDVCQAERERIARDIHDTLLQGTQALLFRLQTWEDHPAIPESLRNELAKVVLQTKSIVIESRERILLMRRAAQADLPEALAAIGHEASVGKGATFDVRVAGEARSLRSEAKDQLIQIAREAVRNAYQHAGARRIVVSLRYRRQSLMMSVVDDGCGIDPAFVESTSTSIHFGLIGMQERATRLRGNLRINSRLGIGTRIEVTAPARIVFQDAPKWPWQGKVSTLALAR
jgi:signal transduction histidine kinase